MNHRGNGGYCLIEFPSQMLTTTALQTFNHTNDDTNNASLSLLMLPFEILTNVFHHTPYVSRMNLALSCKKLARVATQSGVLQFTSSSVKNNTYYERMELAADMPFLQLLDYHETIRVTVICRRCNIHTGSARSHEFHDHARDEFRQFGSLYTPGVKMIVDIKVSDWQVKSIIFDNKFHNRQEEFVAELRKVHAMQRTEQYPFFDALQPF